MAVGALAVAAGAFANAVNNLPALLVGVDALHHMTWGMWAWLLGVNVAAVLLPIGALANLLWLRIMRAEGVPVGLRRYVGSRCPSPAGLRRRDRGARARASRRRMTSGRSWGPETTKPAQRGARAGRRVC